MCADPNLTATPNFINLIPIIVPVISSILGALVGGLITYYVANKSFKRHEEHASYLEQQKVTGLKEALRDEISAIWNRYMITMGKVVEESKNNTSLPYTYPIESDYFTFYNSSGQMIGLIQNRDLRKKIVDTFTHAKGFVDSFRHNSRLANEYSRLKALYEEDTNDQTNKKLLEEQEFIMIDYANQLRKGHYILKDKIEELEKAISDSMSNKIKKPS